MNRDALVDAMAMAAGGTAWPAMTEELHNLLRDGARKGLDVAEPVLRHWFALDARVVSEWQPAETRKKIDGERFLASNWGGNEDDIKILQWSDAFGDFRGEEGMPEYFECWRPMVALPPARPPGSKP